MATEAEAAPATAEPAAQAEPVTDSSGGPAATVSDKHAEIKARLAKAKEAPAETETAGAPAVAASEPDADQHVSAVMAITAERDTLAARIKELEAASQSRGDDSIAALRERVKRDPGVLLDVFGADLGEKPLEAFNDAVLARETPEYKAKIAEDERFSKLEAELEAERSLRRTTEERERDTRARSHTEEALTKGFKDGETVLVDPEKYPYVNHLAATGKVDTYHGIMLAVRELAQDFRGKQKRVPTDAELGKMIAICADKAEAFFAGEAKAYQLAPKAEAAPERRPPRTIGPSMGNGSTAPRAPVAKTIDDKHAEIRARLRKQTASQAAN